MYSSISNKHLEKFFYILIVLKYFKIIEIQLNNILKTFNSNRERSAICFVNFSKLIISKINFETLDSLVQLID